jgi:hypothetical protein
MMINKENEKDEKPSPEPKKESGYVDVARMDVQCHLLIKDKDTKEILVNKRG